MVYENICRIAEKKGMSIHQVEIKSGIGNGVIGRWRKFNPQLKNLKKVSDALGVSVNTLLKEEKREDGDVR